jgi:kinesin family protein 3/17
MPLLQSQPSSSSNASSNDNFKVVIRVRPPLARETRDDVEFRGIVNVSPDNKSCAIMEYLGAEVGELER